MPPPPPPGKSPAPQGPPPPPKQSRSKLVEAIFLGALDVSGDERTAFLAAKCSDDATLRAEVEELLAADAAQPDFLQGVAGDAFKAEEAGEMIGSYKLREQIGEGGFGTVWVADQEKPVRRRVALKIIKLGMDTKEVIARFEQERQALAMMDHPNIAQVFDAGATQWGRPFFVMELVKGMPITQYCDEAGLGTRERLALFGDVCSAINHAHQKGVIHRDIKPSNVMVTLHGDKPVVKVIDFGIAKATQGRLTDHTIYTQFQQMVGTPAYMSPEQAGMSGLDVDTRSDIYALGVLLYELLIGRPPFDGKSLAEAGYEEMRRIIREVEPVKPSSRLSTIVGEERTLLAKSHRIEPEKLGKLVEPDLDWIVMKAIDKDRTRRYETANAFAQDIRRFLADEPVSATPPRAGYRFKKLVRRHRAAIRIAASIVVLLVAATIISSWLAVQANRARAAAESQRQVAQAEAARANEAEKREEQLRLAAEHERADAKRRSYAADMLLCRQALKANNLREARQLLERQRPPEGEEDLRGWEWRWLWNACRSGALYDLGEQKSRALQAIYVNSGRSIVTYELGAVRLIDLDGRRTETLWETSGSSTLSLGSNSGLMTASQDRRWIAAVGQKEAVYLVRIWDRLKNTAPREVAVGEERVSAIAISPDGSTLVTYSPEQNAAFIWDLNNLDNSQPRRIALKLTRRIISIFGAVRFSPDGKMLAVGGVGGEIRLMRTAQRIEDWTDQGTITIDQDQNLGIAALDFSPDGRLIACGRMFVDPRVFIADVETLKTIRVLPGHTGFVAGVAFSPDGKLLASASADQTVKVWDVETWDERGTHLGHTDEVWSVDFSPDSQRLISGGKDRRIEVWPATTFPDRDGSSLTGRPYPHFSPDGRKMLSIANGVINLAGDSVPMVPTELGTDIVRAFWSAPDQIVAFARAPYEIRMWNLATSQIETFPLEFTADGGVNSEYLPLSHLVVFTLRSKEGKDSTVVLWDIATRRQLSSHALPIAKAIRNMPARFSLDGRWMAVPQWDSVAIYDIENGTLATTLAVPSKAGIQGLALSPDGKQLAVARRDEPAIIIMDVATSHTVATLLGHNLVITRLEYSPDGTRLLSSTIGSEAVKVWNAASWMEVARLEPPSGVYYAGPGFTSDGSTIVVGAFRYGGGWSEARLFRAPSWEEIAASEAKAEPQRPSSTINRNK